MFGCVQVRYCKPLTNDLYRVGLSKSCPSVLVRDKEVEIGVATGFHPSIKPLCSKSRAYFYRERSIPECNELQGQGSKEEDQDLLLGKFMRECMMQFE